jgi:surface polysaccharide O-acyltransferase-like enzyme
VILMTLGSVWIARSLDQGGVPAPWLRRCADLTLGVYLLHPLMIAAVWGLGWHVETFSAAASIPLLSALVFGLSLLATWGLQKTPLARRLV